MIRFYASLILLAVLGIASWALHHGGYVSGVADTQAQVSQARDANASAMSTIAQLQMSMATLQLNIILDAAAQSKALAARKQEQLSLTAKFDAARAKLAALLNGDCKTWAQQAACTVTPEGLP